MSQKLKISDLKPHPKNEYLFDDMTGDAWEEFLESIKTSGVIEPIVVTQDKVIVSGHQRVRACKTLHIDEIDAEVRILDSDDEVLKQLIETNIRQRGIGNPNPFKFGLCIKELERIYGIQHGATSFQGNQYREVSPQSAETPKTQADLASELGISVDTLNRYKQLADAIPEIRSLVETGRITKTVALGLMRRLSEEEQKQLADMLPKNEEALSSHKVKFYENRIKTLTSESEDMKSQMSDLEREKWDLEERIKELEHASAEPVIKAPDDYEEIKDRLSKADKSKAKDDAEIKRLNNEVETIRKELLKKQKELDSASTGTNDSYSVKMFVAQCRNFMELAKDQGEIILTNADKNDWSDEHDCVEILAELAEWAKGLSSKLLKK